MNIQKLVQAIFLIIVFGAIVALLYWLIGFLGLPEPFGRVAFGVLAVGSVFALIALLLDMAGYPIVNWNKKE